MSYLRYLFFVCVSWCPTHMVLCLCFVILCLVYPILPVSLVCPFLIALSVLSNVYLKVFVTEHTNSLVYIQVARYYICFA